ncbi:MAG: RHS repeat protein [Sphingopyxis sp.]|nr:RHS repeat protein [Sphingopyxis sp.]
MTTYEYGPDVGPNNLLLRGIVEDANGTILRICYGYDERGNRISETRPEGTSGFSTCP